MIEKFEKVIGECTEYAFSDKKANVYVEYITTQGNSGVNRESFVIKQFDLINDPHVHGYDAKCPETGRPIEIKCEQRQGKKVVSKMAGKQTWASTTDQEKLDSHKENNPIMYVAGFCEETGKCAYAVRYNFNDSDSYDTMSNTIKSRKGKKTSIKTSYKDFENSSSIELLHFDPKYKDLMTKGFYDLLDGLFMKNLEQLSKQEIISYFREKSA